MFVKKLTNRKYIEKPLNRTKEEREISSLVFSVAFRNFTAAIMPCAEYTREKNINIRGGNYGFFWQAFWGERRDVPGT
jgi:hypothetical protein